MEGIPVVQDQRTREFMCHFLQVICISKEVDFIVGRLFVIDVIVKAKMFTIETSQNTDRPMDFVSKSLF